MKKLRSKAGETLTETLVALLIGTLSLAMLASMIGSTAKIITKTQGVLTDYYAATAQLASLELEKDNTDEKNLVTVTDGEAVINFEDSKHSGGFVLCGSSEKTPVRYYSTTSVDTTVTTYERPRTSEEGGAE